MIEHIEGLPHKDKEISTPLEIFLARQIETFQLDFDMSIFSMLDLNLYLYLQHVRFEFVFVFVIVACQIRICICKMLDLNLFLYLQYIRFELLFVFVFVHVFVFVFLACKNMDCCSFSVEAVTLKSERAT